MGILSITCAKCNKSVDRIDFMDTPATMRMLFKVFCHGESETRESDRKFLIDSGGNLIGIAFDGADDAHRLNYTARLQSK